MLSSLKNRRKGNPFFLHSKRNNLLLFSFPSIINRFGGFSNNKQRPVSNKHLVPMNNIHKQHEKGGRTRQMGKNHFQHLFVDILAQFKYAPYICSRKKFS